MAQNGSENAWIQELNTLSSSIKHEVLAMAPEQATIRTTTLTMPLRRLSSVPHPHRCK